MTKEKVLEAMTAAKATPSVATRPWGCARVYVCVTGDKALITAVAAAAKKLGMIFHRKGHGGLTNAIYIGYDNCSGREIGRGEAFATALNGHGISAYMEGVED